MPRKKVTYKGTGKGVSYNKRSLNPTTKSPNQWTGSAMQEKFLMLYLDPASVTFANSYTSAMEAGYTEYTARIIAAPSVNRLWLQQARDIIRMGPEHLTQAIQNEALDRDNKAADRLKALELIGKMQGVFIERKVIAHVGIEQALKELE